MPTSKKSMRPPPKKSSSRNAIPHTVTVNLADAAMALLEREVAKLFINDDLPDHRVRLRSDQRLYSNMLIALQEYPKKPTQAVYLVPLEIVRGQGREIFEVSITNAFIEILRTYRRA